MEEGLYERVLAFKAGVVQTPGYLCYLLLFWSDWDELLAASAAV